VGCVISTTLRFPALNFLQTSIKNMKVRFLLLPLLLSFATGPLLLAQDPPKAAPADADKEPDTELGKKMAKMNSAWRKVRRQVSDATKNEDTLKQLAIVRANANDALKEEPEKKADLPAAEQAKFVADFQSKMKEFIAQLDNVDVALKAGKNDDAAKIVEELGKTQKADHKEFRRPPKK
jgi:soluble cytochrome b562